MWSDIRFVSEDDNLDDNLINGFVKLFKDQTENNRIVNEFLKKKQATSENEFIHVVDDKDTGLKDHTSEERWNYIYGNVSELATSNAWIIKIGENYYPSKKYVLERIKEKAEIEDLQSDQVTPTEEVEIDESTFAQRLFEKIKEKITDGGEIETDFIISQGEGRDNITPTTFIVKRKIDLDNIEIPDGFIRKDIFLNSPFEDIDNTDINLGLPNVRFIRNNEGKVTIVFNGYYLPGNNSDIAKPPDFDDQDPGSVDQFGEPITISREDEEVVSKVNTYNNLQKILSD